MSGAAFPVRLPGILQSHMGDMDTSAAVTARRSARVLMLQGPSAWTDDEIWATVEAVVFGRQARTSTVGECLEELTAALARGILAKERRRSV